MEVSQEISSMVRGWLMASPSARKRKQPPDYVPISPRPERCETLFQSTHSISCSYELWRVHILTFILYGQSREQCSSRPLPSLLTPALIICLPLSMEDGLYTTSTPSKVKQGNLERKLDFGTCCSRKFRSKSEIMFVWEAYLSTVKASKSCLT